MALPRNRFYLVENDKVNAWTTRSNLRLDEVFASAEAIADDRVSWQQVRASPDAMQSIIVVDESVPQQPDEGGVFQHITISSAKIMSEAWSDTIEDAAMDPSDPMHDLFKKAASLEDPTLVVPGRFRPGGYDKWRRADFKRARELKLGTHKATSNKTGTISVSETWSLSTDDLHVTGTITINDSVVVTWDVEASGTINDIEVEGNYIITVNGSIVMANESRTRQLVIKSGQAEPQTSDWQYIHFPDNFDAGCQMIWGTIRDSDYCCLIKEGTSATLIDFQFMLLKNWSIQGIHNDTNGAITTINNTVMTKPGNAGAHLNLLGTGGITFTDCEFSRMTNPFVIANTAQTNTFSKCLFWNGFTDIYTLSTTNITEIAFDNCFVTKFGDPNGGNQMTGGTAINITDCIYDRFAGIPYYASASTAGGALLRVDIIDCYQAGTLGAIQGTATAAIALDNIYLAGNCGAASENVDSDTTTPTSASVPDQYTVVASIANARTTPNFARSVASITDTASDNGATIDYICGVTGSTEIYLGEATAIVPGDRSTYDLTWTGNTDWSGRNSVDTMRDGDSGTLTNRGKPTAVIDGLKAATTYYYVIRHVTPSGAYFDGAEGSFLTTGAAAGGGGGSFF